MKEQLKIGDRVLIKKNAIEIMQRIDAICHFKYSYQRTDYIGFITDYGRDQFGEFYRVDGSLGWYSECLIKYDEREQMIELEKIL